MLARSTGSSGGASIRTILRTRLPERLSGRVPPLLVEVGVGVTSALLLLGIRIALTPIAGDRAPYAFVFLSIVAACVLAGWRSGLIALIIGQFLAWYFVVTSDQAVMVPEAAIVPFGGQMLVMKVVDGKAQPQPVTLGLRREGKVQVTEGLAAGDVVVTAGQMKLQPGAAVAVLPPEAAPPANGAPRT